MKIHLFFIQNIKIILLALVIFCSLPANALQIVYPKTQTTIMSANSTFIIGNTTPNSCLKINNKEVKVYSNGSFVEVVSLSDGDNIIEIDSKNEVEHLTLSYLIKKVPKTKITQEEKEEIFPENEYIYASIIKNNTPLRKEPNEESKRITHLDKDTVLMLNGKKGDYYRVSLTHDKNAWVKADNIINYSTINEKMLTSATNVTLTEDKNYTYIKTDLAFHVPFVITETDKGLNIEIFNIKDNACNTKLFKQTGEVKSFAINNVSIDNTSTYYIELKNKLWGYDVSYEENTLILKIRKKPIINDKEPLKGLTITIDAGHGGDDFGAIGPTNIKEKDINLDISKKLQNLLEESGAIVTMTRTDDSTVDLYDRPKKAKESDSLFLISIHANALPDGYDPYKKHGTSVFYYNNEAEEFARIMKDEITKELNTRDDGLYNCSFVLTRPTMPISILIEIAYMIHPYEYTLLLDDDFRLNAAKSIKNGIIKYLLKEAK